MVVPPPDFPERTVNDQTTNASTPDYFLG